jgi:hypothetical protein
MKHIWGVFVVLAVVVALPVEEAAAQPILLQRCNADNLDPVAATARIEWARKCALLTRVGNPNNWFDTGMPALNGGNLVDYLEADAATNPNGLGTFSGPNYGFEVNYAFTNTLFLSGGTSQTTEANGYRKWFRDATRKRPRPLYPTFGSTASLLDATNVQLKPGANPDDCRLFNSQGAATSVYYVNGYCEASCYAPEQKLQFEGGEESIVDALANRREDLITLAPDATLDNVRLMRNQTFAYTAETRDTKHVIFEISTESGGKLRVTDEHPVINGEGRMVAAKTLKVGEELVRKDGTFDSIVSIVKTEHFGKVYNLQPVSQDLVSNVLIAEGFLVGSSRFQNDDVAYMNRVILYRGVPAAVIP